MATAAGGAGLALADLAARVGGEVRGDGSRRIAGIRGLADAGPDDLSLLKDRRHRAAARASRAGALLVPRGAAPLLAGLEGRDLLLVDRPDHAFATLLELFHPPVRPRPGVHATAIVGAGCTVDPSAHVGPYAVIGDGTTLAAEAVVEALAVVGRGCRIGRGARLHPHAVVYDGCELGAGVELHSGAVVGSDGFGYASRGGEHRKVPQVGRAVLEDGVEVGANSAIDRATLGETRVGAGSKIDNLVQVGHNVRLGRGVVISGQGGVAGSATVGDGVMIGGQSGVSGHLEIGDGALVAAKSAVFRSVPAGRRVAGIPAVEMGAWRRQVTRLARLDGLARRLAALERRLGLSPGEDDAEEG